jgi:membrane peptidoglycan carboxypeptidase
MRKRDHNIFASAASLLICGVLAGVVVAAAAFPAIAMGGLAAKASADGFGELPTELDTATPPPQITYVYASDNKTLLATFYDENRHDIPLTDVPQIMHDAILAAEDQEFYKHKGVDLQGIVRAFVANQQGASTQGASTLTMQYVRQQITYTATSPAEVIAATEPTNARKLREIRLALALETVMSKPQILENYLNIAAFGHGAYGIYAASQVYFNKEPKDLTLEEAALLAALPKAPSSFDPVTEEGRPQALERRNWILGEMAELGKISPEQRDAAMAAEIKVTGNRTPNGCVTTMVAHWGFFCDYFARWWNDQTEFGKDVGERNGRLRSGGYTIVTTMDVGIQDSAKRNVETEIPTGSSDALMLAALEPGTGRVRALAANRDYDNDDSGNPLSTDPGKAARGIKGTYPKTTNPLLTGGGDVSGYKAGSAYKILTMITALEKGYPLDYEINTRSPYQSKYIVGVNDASGCADRRHWCPRNASASMSGQRNMWTGFGMSVNTYFVPLIERVGADSVVAMAERLGTHFRNDNDRRFTSLENRAVAGPFTLGVTDAVPLELANIYATLAADGLFCEPTPVFEVRDRTGAKLPGVGDPKCHQELTPEVARATIDAARCPVYDRGGLHKCGGGTTGSYFTGADGKGGKTAAQAVGQPLFGKTGTTETNWTANLAIATKHLAVATTLANPDFALTSHNAEFPRKTNRAAVHTMRDAMQGKEAIDFPVPPRELIVGKKVAIPKVECQSVNAARSAIERAGFTVYVSSEKVGSACPAGTVAGTDPAGSTSKGSEVQILVSNGQAASPPPPGEPPGPGRGGGGGGG